MERIRVRSSNIRSIGYDEITHTLEIEFHHGGIYQYYKVPKSVFEAFMATRSKGKFFFKNIKEKYKWDPVPVDFGEKKNDTF